MSNYHLKPLIPPSLLAQDAKEKRRKVLEAVRARRRDIYRQFREHREEAYRNREED